MVELRAAERRDLDAIVAFEVEIATVSFGDDAVVDPGTHRRRLEKAFGGEGDVMLVAVDEGRVAGWLWMSARTNFLTGERYANLRSLAGAGSELLLDAAVERARVLGLREIVGRVNVSNLAMRVLYAKAGFAPEHLTMRRSLP